MRFVQVAVVSSVLALGGVVAHTQSGPPLPPPPPAPPASLAQYVPASAVTSLGVISNAFDQKAAMDLVVYMDQFWRNAGNAGFNATIDHIKARLTQSGFPERGGTAPASGPAQWVEEYGKAQGWDYTVGTLTLAGGTGGKDDVLLSRQDQRVALCINSFSTPAGGVNAPIVDVGQGSDADFAKIEAKGAVVLGDASIGRLWQAAVTRRGAIGVISTSMEDYIRPGSTAADAARPRSEWNVLQWGSIPYDETRKAFGFKSTPKAAARIRERLKTGAATVKVEIASSFSPGPYRTLVAEIPGTVAPDQRIVLAAHIQEPGANDNATGCATLQELARAIAAGIKAGTLPKPARTLTFMWLEEIRGSRQWLTDHPVDAKRVRYMFSLDMTGEDPAKTGGPFLIEKMPDPSAVWARPSDPHTEWGSGQYRESGLKGSLLNDVFLAVCQRRAAGTNWVVRTNPYEGGSDHSVYLQQGVPAILAWHFPDWFYHASLDRPDKTSPAEMKHVGVSIAATALLLAGATDADARDLVGLLDAAATARLALERRQGMAIVGAAPDKAAAEAREAQITAAWVKWYGEALGEIVSLPAGGASDALKQKVDQATARLAKQ